MTIMHSSLGYFVSEKTKDWMCVLKMYNVEQTLYFHDRLAVVILPIIGIGAFLWWAGKDVVRDTCPSGGQEFQTLKSLMIDELQMCPYCGQPSSVVEDKFVSGSGNFNSTPFGQIFNDFSPQSKKGQKVSSKVVDVEAEVRDVD